MDSEIYAPGLLAGRVVLVTGGGTNLGREAARELLAAGATVVIAGRRQEVLDAACRELGCTSVTGDVREEAARIVADVVARHGRLDVLVNNAGGQYFVPAEAISDKGWAAVQRLNVGGTLAMMEAAAPHAETIVNVTVSPHGGMPAMAHTGAARAAVEALGREPEWIERGIAVVALAVGRFDTDSIRKYPEVVTQALARTVPAQRLGTMQEFGWAVVLLASATGRHLGGSTLTLDGGLDNWEGPWPTPANSEEGVVPTETRVRR